MTALGTSSFHTGRYTGDVCMLEEKTLQQLGNGLSIFEFNLGDPLMSVHLDFGHNCGCVYCTP